MEPIRCALVGVGNCASALVQGVHFYRKQQGAAVSNSGISYPSIGGYEARDIVFAAAWDVDARKVGTPLHAAIFAEPNCCYTIDASVAEVDSPLVRMGPVLDGVAPHMLTHEPAARSFRLADATPDSAGDIVAALRAARVDVLINYLPVGSQAATEFWAEVCLEARVP